MFLKNKFPCLKNVLKKKKKMIDRIGLDTNDREMFYLNY